MERTLEDQERHLLVKVIDRVLYKLDDLVRPYVLIPVIPVPTFARLDIRRRSSF